MIPRILIAGTNSGCGKTTVTCAVLQALKNRGLRLMAYKSGPDYIDPMFHSKVIGTESGNLDLFFTERDTACYLLERHAQNCDLTVMEGAMGYYDGIALSSQASAWELACETSAPVVLVVDGRGSGVSLCAVIQGFLNYQSPSQIQGVILNRVSSMLYPRLKAVIEAQCGVSVLGYLPAMPQCSIESRHLGLVTAGELSDLKEKIHRLAEQAEKSINLDGLINLAKSAPAICYQPPQLPGPVAGYPTIAVARDSAFCFYYRDNLELLERMGAKLVFFSPLNDTELPLCHGLYIGGGYPELYAEALSKNESIRLQIREAIQSGLPAVAECGGFLYLQKELEDQNRNRFPMCGVFDGRGYKTDRLRRFGYITLTPQKDGLLCKENESVPAHEFHYWDVENSGSEFHAQKPLSDRGWNCAFQSESLYAGFPHFYFYAYPEMARRFVCAALRKKEAEQ